MKIVAAIAIALLSASQALANADAPPANQGKPDLSGLHDFDFVQGEWRVHHRELKDRLAGSHEWIEFDGTQKAWLVMGGYANVDENVFNKPDGTYRGVTIRTYDPKTGEWSIWWVDGRMPGINLDPPVRGRFVNGVGIFYANDTLRGKPIKVRYTWKPLTHNTSHWEQAFSADGGKTWETNWITDFTRISEKASP